MGEDLRRDRRGERPSGHPSSTIQRGSDAIWLQWNQLDSGHTTPAVVRSHVERQAGHQAADTSLSVPCLDVALVIHGIQRPEVEAVNDEDRLTRRGGQCCWVRCCCSVLC